MVQFAKSRYDPFQYALKFYLDLHQFHTEAALLSESQRSTATAPTSSRRKTPDPNVRDTHHMHGAASAHARQPQGRARPGQETHRSFLPHVVGVYPIHTAALTGPQGQRLPPCVVMQRGEPLQEWMGRSVSEWGGARTVRVHFQLAYLQNTRPTCIISDAGPPTRRMRHCCRGTACASA